MTTNTAPEFNVEVVSRYDFEQTLHRLRGKVEAEGLLLLYEIDTQKIVKSKDIEIDGLRQLLFFHPRYIKTILDHNSSGVVEAPLKLVVMEMPLPNVVVRYIRPSYLFGRYAGLAELGNTLNHVMANLVAAVTG